VDAAAAAAKPAPTPAAIAAPRHAACRRAAEAGATAEVRTTAPTAISAVNILELFIRASQLRVSKIAISMRARSGSGSKSLLCDRPSDGPVGERGGHNRYNRPHGYGPMDDEKGSESCPLGSSARAKLMHHLVMSPAVPTRPGHGPFRHTADFRMTSMPLDESQHLFIEHIGMLPGDRVAGIRHRSPLVILQMGRPGAHQRRRREEIGVGRHDKDRHRDGG
jgi:hypothetical protein